MQETIEGALKSLPSDSDLDTKLTIKTEPMDSSGDQPNGEVMEPPHKRIKTEVSDGDKSNEEDSEEGDVNQLDEMMCDIVDALQ